MKWVDKHIENYYNWLKSNTVTLEDSATEWTLISTPFHNNFNDHIELYAKKIGNEIILSDDGETLSNLSLLGVEFKNSNKRKHLFERILFNNNVTKNEEDELIVKGDIKNFSKLKHNLLTTIIEVNDFNILTKSNVSSLFKEDVKMYLDSNIDLIYTPDFILKGNSGLDFNFDFQIAGKKKEILLKSFSDINQSTLTSYLYSLSDVKDDREYKIGKSVSPLVILNDSDKKIKSEYFEALKKQDVEIILWSKKDSKESKDKLVA